MASDPTNTLVRAGVIVRGFKSDGLVGASTFGMSTILPDTQLEEKIPATERRSRATSASLAPESLSETSKTLK